MHPKYMLRPMNTPVMDFWVSTSIFLSAQGKEDQFGHGHLLSETVTERETVKRQMEQSSAPKSARDPRHLVFAR